MQAAKRFIESYLGIPPSGPGQGTAWRIESRSVGPEGWSDWLVVAMFVLIAAGILALYLREARRLSFARRLTLAGLRLAGLGLLVAMISQTTLAVDRTGLPVLALLIDDSASMSLTEGSSTSSGAGLTRFDLVRSTLANDDARFLKSLSRRFRSRVYRFSGDASPLAIAADDGNTDNQTAQIVASLKGLNPDGDETRPATAVRRVLDDLRGLSPSAVVVFTDGVPTTGDADALSAVASLAARRRSPLYPVGVGSSGPARDIELYELLADDIAFLGDPVRVTARLRSFGYRGTTLSIRLTDQETGDLLAQSSVVAEGDGRPVQKDLSFTPEAEGELDVVVTVRGEGQESDSANNSAARRISVRKQKVRVLLADRAPRYEFRFLKTLLERESTIELDTVLQDADLGYSSGDRTALARFPLRTEEILAYDVIFFGDLDPSLLGPEVLSSIVEFVRTKGGGFIGIAGPQFFPLRYVGTPLEPLLPIQLSEAAAPAADSLLADAFRPRLTLQGRQSGPMFRLEGDDARSLAVWDSLPGFFWRIDAPTLRPGAVTLAEAPDFTGRQTPVIALQRFGAGKALLHLTDETWRWRWRTGDLYFGRYWLQAIRYLSRASLIGGLNGAELISDRRSYSQGDAVTLRVRFTDERLLPSTPSGVTVFVEDRTGGRQQVELSRNGELSDAFEGRIERLPEGSYHAWIREPAFTGSPPAVDFRVDPPDRELSRRAADIADLRRAAEHSGGKYYDLKEADLLLRQLPAGRAVRLEAAEPRPLWNRPELMLAFAGLLTAEWLLRKRGRLA